MKVVNALFVAIGLLFAVPAMAQQNSAADAPTAEATETGTPPEVTGEGDSPVTAAEFSATEGGAYVPRKPVEGIGMPRAAEIDFAEQFSPTGKYAKWINNSILLPIITIISLFVLALLIWVIVRYRRSANPEPSKTTHNTLIEVIWTLAPVLILVGIAIPSIDLLAEQYEPAPDDAVTIKATGYQWYWGYTYPDHGGFEVISNMLSREEAEARGEPNLLAADNRMVVPAGVPLRIQTTAADVIHSFAVPALWFKLDAVPGRLNEKATIITEPGVYYGQCSELCGARHAFMPIVVEALPMAEFEAWVQEQGGTLPGAEEEGETTSAEATAEIGEALSSQDEPQAPAAVTDETTAGN